MMPDLMKVNCEKRSTSFRVCWDQAVKHRQDKSGGLAAAGLRRHPQVTPLQRERDGRCLHRRRLDKFKLGHGFEQAFVQGELGKHGCYLEDMQKNSCIGYRFRALRPSFFIQTA